jgi:hypothetical protein
MKSFLQTFGSVLIMLGLISAAGMAGDCDGKCMENANPISVMLLIGTGALVSMALGLLMIVNSTER